MPSLSLLRQRLQTRWQQLPTQHLEILRGATWLLLFIGIGKLIGLLKEMIVASQLGVGAEMDAFLLALTLSGMLAGPIVHALTNCLSTSYAEWGQRPQEEGFQKFQGTVNTLVLLTGAALWGLQHWLLPFLPKLLGIELEPESLARMMRFSEVLNLYIPLTLLMGVVSTRLLMRKQQINTLLDALPALCTILACLFWPNGVDGWTLVTGFLVGSLLQWGIMEALQWGQGAPFRLEWKISPEIVALFHRIRWMLPAQVLTASTTLVDHTMASWLGTGSLSTLGYATRVLAILLTLTQTVLGRATLPVFGSLRADPELLRQTVRQWHRIALFGGGIVAIGTALIAEPLIQLLFERGAFTAADTLAVRNVLWAYLLQVPFYLAGTILWTALTIQGRQQSMLIGAGLVAIPNFLLNYFLIPHLGAVGIALSTSCCYLISWIFYFSKTK